MKAWHCSGHVSHFVGPAWVAPPRPVLHPRQAGSEPKDVTFQPLPVQAGVIPDTAPSNLLAGQPSNTLCLASGLRGTAMLIKDGQRNCHVLPTQRW